MHQADLKHENPLLEQKLRHLYGLNRKKSGIDFDLWRKPYTDLLKNLGEPHTKLPPVIHVAGTNGKGSSIAMLRAMLEAAGYAVHAYTSPHLVHFNERIVLRGKEITDDALETLIDRALSLNNGADITFFEITTAMAFAAFAETPADIVLLEVGMGGRLDCTNIIDKPLATLITAIGMDHMEYLGETLPEIAAEKAGIMKPNAPCVIAHQSNAAIQAGVLDVFRSHAKKIGAPLIHASQHPSFTSNLTGQHQIHNMNGALSVLDIVKDRFLVSRDIRIKGLQSVEWQGRLQNITSFFRDAVPAHWEVWLDGAHNTDGAEALAAQAAQWHAQDSKLLHLIFGMLQTKNPRDFLKPLAPFMQSTTAVPIPHEPKSFAPETLAEMLDIHSAKNIGDALATIQKNHPSGHTRILIAGSLYLAGHMLGEYSRKL